MAFNEQILKVTSKQFIKRRLPANLNEIDLPHFTNPKRLVNEIPETFIYLLRNVNVSFEGVVFKNFKTFTPSLITPDYKNEFNVRYLLKEYLLKKKIIIKEKSIVIHNSWSNGYFHWMMDALPRLIASKEFISDVAVLIPESQDPNLLSCLEVFPIKKIIEIPKGAYIHAEELVMPMHVTPSGDYNAEILNSLKQYILKYFGDKLTLNLGSNIYISREKASKRKIANETELMDLLTEFGFIKVNMEDYSFIEQLSIAYHAKNIISIHGAGLTNMFFMKDKGKVLEILNERVYCSHCYYSLASMLNMDYYYQFAKPVAEKDWYHSDLMVDINTMRNNLEKMIL